jgi:hypothetical protein
LVSPFDGNSATGSPGDNKYEMTSSPFTVTNIKDVVFNGINQGKTTYTMDQGYQVMHEQALVKMKRLEQT